MRIFPTSFKYFLFNILIFFFAFTSTVTAFGKPPDVGAQNATGQGEQGRQQAKTRLTEAKLRACQAKEDAIVKRASRLIQLAGNMEDKFDKHTQRVEVHYTSKVVPSGKTVVNYDSLIADIQIKKTAVQTALTTAQNDADNFDCAGDNPKDQLTQFRKDMQAVKKALKDYRTSIKNLIVAVRSVVGATERENKQSTPSNTDSPKPTSSPRGNE